MYFWKVGELKRELTTGSVSQRDQFGYVLASTLFAAFFGHSLLAGTMPWGALYAIGYLAITVGGIYCLYRINGGANGVRFLERVISLGWVILVRWFVIFALTMVILDAYLWTPLRGGKAQADYFSLAVSLVLQVLYFLLLIREFRDLSRPAT